MKYLIREIGWVFNDSTFENDGAYHNIQVFNTKDEALEKKAELELEYFLYNLDVIHRFESYGDYRTDFRIFKERVTKYLVETLNFNPTIQLIGHSGYCPSMFLKELNSKDVQAILEAMNIDFFSVVEIEDNNHKQYEAKLNPHYYNYDEGEYLWDYHGTKKLRFDNKLHAHKRLIKEDYYFYELIKPEVKQLRGNMEELSMLPDLLNTFIDSEEHLSYNNGQLSIKSEINPKSLEQLSELLKEPFLFFEEVESANNKFDDTLSFYQKHNKIGKEIIHKQSFNQEAIDNFCLSKEYLIDYSFSLSMDKRFFNYRDIIEKHISRATKISCTEKYGNSYYKSIKIELHGVIKSIQKEETIQVIEGCFGYGSDQISSISKVGIGKNHDLETAFEESLVDWLENYGNEYIDYLEDLNKEHNNG